MIVCLCKNISDLTIKKYRSLKILQTETEAGTDCGACLCYIEDLLEENNQDEEDNG